MLEKLNQVRNYEKFLGIFLSKNSWEGYTEYKWTCDLCGKEKIFRVDEHDYNGWSGNGWLYQSPTQLVIEYGKFNKRKISICPDHTDTQIEKKLEELKD